MEVKIVISNTFYLYTRYALLRKHIKLWTQRDLNPHLLETVQELRPTKPYVLIELHLNSYTTYLWCSVRKKLDIFFRFTLTLHSIWRGSILIKVDSRLCVSVWKIIISVKLFPGVAPNHRDDTKRVSHCTEMIPNTYEQWVQLWRNCVLSGGTQRRALPRHQNE